MTVRLFLDPERPQDYATFLRIKALPRFRFQGHVAEIPDEYASLLGYFPDVPTSIEYEPEPFLYDYQGAIAGIALTMTTGIGAPLSGTLYTLSGLAAIVIGGVSLSGGRGGLVGPVMAAFLLALIPTDLIFLNIDPNYGQVIQGTLIVFVVMVGGFAAARQDSK